MSFERHKWTSIISRLVAATMLVWALGSHSYDFYVLLRWVVCVVSAYMTYTSYTQEKQGWVWTFGIIALFFNPLIPVHLSRETWGIIDLATGGIFVASLFVKSLRDSMRN